MQTLLRVCLLTAAAGLASTQLTTSASAQAPCSDPDCVAAEAAGNACRVYVVSGTGTGTDDAATISGRIVNYVRAQPEGCYDPSKIYGLQGWRLNMRDDRKIGRIAIMQNGGSLTYALQDSDGGEYVDGFVWLVPLPEGTEVRSVSARECTGTCQVQLEPKNPDDVVVLVGFDVTRAGGDGHVERFSIGPALGSPGLPSMQVNFSDDDFAYRPVIQYAYVPASAVAARGDVQRQYSRPGNGRLFSPGNPGPNLLAPTARGDAVLQSFAFTFRNGGHFLEDVGLERRNGAYEAWFQDGQSRDDRRHPDDPFSWRARFVILN